MIHSLLEMIIGDAGIIFLKHGWCFILMNIYIYMWTPIETNGHLLKQIQTIKMSNMFEFDINSQFIEMV